MPLLIICNASQTFGINFRWAWCFPTYMASIYLPVVRQNTQFIPPLLFPLISISVLRNNISLLIFVHCSRSYQLHYLRKVHIELDYEAIYSVVNSHRTWLYSLLLGSPSIPHFGTCHASVVLILGSCSLLARAAALVSLCKLSLEVECVMQAKMASFSQYPAEVY